SSRTRVRRAPWPSLRSPARSSSAGAMRNGPVGAGRPRRRGPSKWLPGSRAKKPPPAARSSQMRIGAGVAIIPVSLAIAASLGVVRADPNARSEAVVAKVGSTEITVASLEQRMKSIPDFQLATFGKTPDEQKRNFLEQVLVREALFAEGAIAKKLEQSA